MTLPNRSNISDNELSVRLRGETFQGVPLHPRFIQELAVVTFGDKVVIDGTNRLQILRGRAWQELLLKLIPRMDGTKSLDELHSELRDVPQEHLRAAVSSLHALGLVEYVQSSANYTIESPETLDFLRRQVGTTRANRSGMEAYQRLRASQVVFVCPDAGSSDISVLSSLLRSAGVSDIVEVSRASLEALDRSIATDPESLLIMSVAIGHEDYEWHAKLDDWCAGRGLSWLRVATTADGQSADLGPLFRRDDNPCYRCFRALHDVPLSMSLSSSSSRSALKHFWTALVAIEIVYLLSRIGPPATTRGFQRHDLARGTSKQLRWPRLPTCQRCNASASDLTNSPLYRTEEALPIAVVYEEYVCPEPKRTSWAKRPVIESEHSEYSQSEPMPMEPESQMPNCAEDFLGKERPELGQRALDVLQTGSAFVARDGAITKAELGSILLLTAGIRDERLRPGEPRRWAATAGNLGSVQLWIAVRDIVGLQPGIYFYDGVRHALAKFERQIQERSIEEFLSASLLNDAGRLPDAVVFFSGALAPVAEKYGEFGYRLINLDAGAGLSQLHLIAESLGITCKTINFWADDIIEERLNLKAPQEQITAVLTLFGNKGTRALNKSFASQKEMERSAPAENRLQKLSELTVSEVLEALVKDSRMTSHKNCELTPTKAYMPTTTSFAQPSMTQLPPPCEAAASTETVLANRISVRTFAVRAVSTSELSTMLKCAYLGDARDWPQEHKGGAELTFIVVGWRLTGATSGVYVYDPTNHALSYRSEPPSKEAASDLFVQSEFAAAPAFIWIAGNLAAACAQHGSFGHRVLLLRAGAAGHRLWAAAISMGMAGCLVAGLVPSAGRRYLGLDGYQRASLIGLAVGHPSVGQEGRRPLPEAAFRSADL